MRASSSALAVPRRPGPQHAVAVEARDARARGSGRPSARPRAPLDCVIVTPSQPSAPLTRPAISCAVRGAGCEVGGIGAVDVVGVRARDHEHVAVGRPGRCRGTRPCARPRGRARPASSPPRCRRRCSRSWRTKDTSRARHRLGREHADRDRERHDQARGGRAGHECVRRARRCRAAGRRTARARCPRSGRRRTRSSRRRGSRARPRRRAC